MRAQTFEDPTRISPTRTVAWATAFAVHVGALMFLFAPSRPQAHAQLDAIGATDVYFVEPPIPPPPPPPPEDPPPRPQQVAMQQPPPEVPVTPEVPCTTCDVIDDTPLVTDIPVSDPEPISPPGPTNDSFSDAHADARYGTSNKVRYPRVAVIKREQGEVHLRILIGRNGTPQQVELARSSGSRNLDIAARKSVMNWRFVPAERNGEAVEAWVIVPIVFNLNEA